MPDGKYANLLVGTLPDRDPLAQRLIVKSSTKRRVAQTRGDTRRNRLL
jgi:hypothetical protein